MCVYIYILYIYMCVYMYIDIDIDIDIYRRGGKLVAYDEVAKTLSMPFGLTRDTPGIDLHKILSLWAIVHESIDLLLPPPTCIVHTIAIRLHDDCAIYDPTPTRLLYVMHHTILVMTMSCKGQVREHSQPTTSASAYVYDCVCLHVYVYVQI